MTTIRIAVGQAVAESGAIARNAATACRLLAQARERDARLLLLPELFLCGYDLGAIAREPEKMTIDLDSPELAALRACCREHAVALVVGACLATPGCRANAALVIGADGEIVGTYDKIHLWTTEQPHFVPGAKPLLLEIAGFRVGLAICYDAGFPEHCRALALAGAELVLCPSAFSRGEEERRYELYFPMRALENTVYLAVANLVGRADGLDFFGRGAIFAPSGAALATAGADEEVIVAEIDHDTVTAVRRELRYLAHRRPDVYGELTGRRPGMSGQRFPRAEFEGRLERLRAAMAERGVELALVHSPENVCYLTGHETPGYYVYQCLLVPAGGEPTLLMRETETVNARIFTYLEDVQGYPDTVDPVDATLEAIRARGFPVAAVGLEERSWFLPPLPYRRLRDALAAETVVPIDDLVARLRLVKSPLEIAAMREAARVTSAAMDAALAAVAAGVPEREVAATIFATLVREGCEYLGMEPFVASGTRSGAIHASWSDRVIGEDETVLIEIGAAVKRYHAALMRTAAVGELPPRLQQMADVCLAALTAAVDQVRPGNTPQMVDRACKEVIAAAGLLDCYRKRTGYSIGLAFAPDWGEGHILSLRDGEQTPFAPGMVVHVVPALRQVGLGGVGFSETVLITTDGHEVLTSVPRALATSTAA
jgi:Xaa-Pro dipeptidase